MTDHIFTFGYGQSCPYTGKSLADHYATIVAPDPETARKLMLGLFGQVWSHQYASLDNATRGGQFPMTEHVRIDLTPGATAIPARLRVLAEKWATTAAYIPLQQLGRDVLAILDGESGGGQ